MAKLKPEIIIFDVDGVLVDVRESYHRTIVDTVRYFTGRKIPRSEIHRWKNRGGYNDDWKLTHALVRSLNHRVPYKTVKAQFERFYWGENLDGNVARERWELPRAALARLARRFELALFTGRTHRELDHTLDRFAMRRYFRQIVTVEDVQRPKPDPDGLLCILDGTDPGRTLYLGDNVDDALAAKRARVPFLGVLSRGSAVHRLRVHRLRELGARAILGTITELEKHLR